jgi:hypothetical protein
MTAVAILLGVAMGLAVSAAAERGWRAVAIATAFLGPWAIVLLLR